jgi:anti-anti-sigma factor
MFGDLDIDISRNGTRSLVRVHGDIDRKTAPKLRAAILDLFEMPAQERVIVDLHEARHIDHFGASSLVVGFEAARSRNADFILTGLN